MLDWRLTCDPAGGSHPRPEKACAALAANEEALDAVPPDVACTEIYGGPQEAELAGTYRGRRVRVLLKRTDGCEIARWERLKPVVEPG